MFEERFFYHLATSQGNYKEMTTCSLNNQTQLPEESNPKGTQRNKIW